MATLLTSIIALINTIGARILANQEGKVKFAQTSFEGVETITVHPVKALPFTVNPNNFNNHYAVYHVLISPSELHVFHTLQQIEKYVANYVIAEKQKNNEDTKIAEAKARAVAENQTIHVIQTALGLFTVSISELYGSRHINNSFYTVYTAVPTSPTTDDQQPPASCAGDQPAERFDVIGNDETPRARNDRFMCKGCGLLFLAAGRVEACRDTRDNPVYTCPTCASKPASELLAPRPITQIPAYRLTGSYQNRLYENMAGMPEPVPGMGAAEIMHSDRYAFTVMKVISPNKIVVRRDLSTMTSGSYFSESQTYAFSANPSPNGDMTLRRNKYGQWKVEGGSTKFLVGRRMEYRDPSF